MPVLGCRRALSTRGQMTVGDQGALIHRQDLIELQEGDDPLRLDPAEVRDQPVPAMATAIDDADQVVDGEDAGGQQVLGDDGVDPQLDRVTGAWGGDDPGFEGVDSLTQTPAQAIALFRFA